METKKSFPNYFAVCEKVKPKVGFMFVFKSKIILKVNDAWNRNPIKELLDSFCQGTSVQLNVAKWLIAFLTS